MTFHNVILGFALDLRADFPAFARFHLMVFAITRAHGGHALAIYGAHGALYATSHYQAGAKQQGSKSHRGVSHEFPVHVCFLRHSCVVYASPSLSGVWQLL